MNVVSIILWTAVVVTAITANTVPEDNQDVLEQWALYKIKYQRYYPDPAEENFRLNIFADNLHKVDAHNRAYARGETTFGMGLNDMSDMTRQEIRSTHVGALPTPQQWFEIQQCRDKMYKNATRSKKTV